MPTPHDVAMREIAGLRRQGQAVGAFERAVRYMTQEVAFPSDAFACWKRHFQADRCLLLEFVHEARAFPQEVSLRISPLEDEAFQQRLHGAGPLLKARVALLRALIDSQEPHKLVSRLRESITLYDREWSLGSPSPRAVVAGQSQPLPIDDRWNELFASLTAEPEFGVSSPGLAAARDTAVWLWGDAPEVRRGEASLSAWVLLVSKHPVSRDEAGFVARLTLEQVPGGGAIYPHPLTGGYQRIDEDFRRGLANALQAAACGSPWEFDVRWRIELVGAEERWSELAGVPLTGRSAEVAFACALRALKEGEQLDRHVAVTACFKDPIDAPFELASVVSVALKISARELQESQIDEVVVAPSQSELKTLADGKVPLVEAADFESAWEKLSHWRRMTTLACKGIASQAAAGLAESCGEGNRYVVPSLSVERVARGDEATALERPAQDGRKLAACDVENVVLQQHGPPNRTCLLADSGLGKSTFLLYSQQRIAAANDGRVPILVPHLSDLDWRDGEQVVARLSDRLIPYWKGREVHARDWLRRLVRNGEAVFLLDALDQTSTVEGLANFIDSVAAGQAGCSIVVSGRPFVSHSRATAFRGEWQTLRLDPFDQDRQRKYLGEVLAARLLNEDSLEWVDPAEYAKRQQWADLLEVPLLLKLLRIQASSGDLDQLTNRHAIYANAVAELVRQGKKSLAETQYADSVVDQTDVERVLCPLAWKMVAGGNFTGIAAGQEYADLRNTLNDPKLLHAITQINLTTLESLLEHPNELRFAWRHPSFCEYFAGLHLGRMYAGNKELADAVRLNARDPHWRWTLRFALSELQAKGEDPTQMAADLMRYGNPFVVADSLRHDHLELPAELDRLCRWLVHHDCRWGDCWDESWSKPAPNEETLALLEAMFRREHRDSRCLHAAWELLDSFLPIESEPIHTRFLSEFQQILNGGGEPEQQQVAQEFLEGFIPIPPVCEMDADLEFWMGSPESEIGRSADELRHRVRINRPIQMHRFPVTNEVFSLFDPLHDRTPYSQGANSPAVEVSWYQAALFCLWLGQAPVGGHYRLPDEAEWEFTCRAGTETAFWFDNDQTRLIAHAHYVSNSNGKAQATGTPEHCNRWGLCDMHGNVWEWCQDWYDKGWYRERAGRYGGGMADADSGPPTGINRVIRGGGWNMPAGYCRSAIRRGQRPDKVDCAIGFRVVR